MTQHLAYLTLWRLAGALQPLAGHSCTAAFCQQRDELVLGWQHPTLPWLRISCGSFPYLLPVEDFARKRANAADIFPGLPGHTLQAIHLLQDDRVLRLSLDGGAALYLYMYGARGNVLWVEKGADPEPEAFRQDVPVPWPLQGHWLKPAPGPPPIAEAQPRWVDPGLQRYLSEQHISLAQYMDDFSEGPVYAGQLEGSPAFVLHRLQGLHAYDLLPGLREYVQLRYGLEHYRRQYAQTDARVQQRLRLATARLTDHTQAIADLHTARSPEELGHLLMAQLHLVAQGAEQVVLEDYYQGGKLTLKLDPLLSPAENAERYYHRHKDRQKRLAWLHTQTEGLQQAAAEAQVLAEAWQQVTDAATLRAFLKAHPKLAPREQEKSAPQTPPFRHFQYQGWDIYVGRNAQNNDRLSFGFARPNDLWLHARDVQGSHVVVRRPLPQVPVPAPVLEYAAGLAAWYSKQRNATLATVSYTEKKYVRKHKKLAAGQVMMDREQTLLVPPLDPGGNG